MKSWEKRLLASLLAVIMAVSLTACFGGEETGEQTDVSTAGEGMIFTEPTTIRWIIQSHVSWPYNENWAVWKKFQELTGATFSITAIPNESFYTKLNLLMADGGSDLPDLIAADSKGVANEFGPQGALIAIDDYIDQMPNYTAFWNAFSEEEREARLAQRKSSDGKTYYPQNAGTEERQGIRSWLYRKDIFEKHNLEVPTDWNELYEVCKQLKELYPESYPFCLREGLRNIGVMGSQWKPYFDWDYYYDFNNEKWSYGVLEPTMLEIVKYMLKMYQEGLIPPGYLTDPTKSWEEFMTTDRGFILCDFVVRVDNFNNPCRLENPEYTLAAMVPPKANTETGTNLMQKWNVDPKGIVIVNTGDKERIGNAIKLVDWMYTDEAEQMVWGIEGESYEVREDGLKSYIRPEDGDLEGAYGLFSYGTYLRADPKAAKDIASPEQQIAVDLALGNTIDKYDPSNWIALTDEERNELNLITDSLNSYVESMLHKYLMGDEPLSTWDSFVKEVEKMGVNDALAIYAGAYDRVNK